MKPRSLAIARLDTGILMLDETKITSARSEPVNFRKIILFSSVSFANKIIVSFVWLWFIQFTKQRLSLTYTIRIVALAS